MAAIYPGIPNPAGPAYLGQIANKCLPPDQLYAPGKQFNNWTTFRAADDISALQIWFANWYGAETAVGAAATVAASVEYPIGGTITQLAIGGSPTLSLTNGGQGAFDLTALPTTIPRGAKFRIRSFYQCAAGMPFHVAFDAQTDKSDFAPSGLADKTMSGSVTGDASGAGYGPVLVLGYTRRPSIVSLGDSIDRGASDSYDDLSGDRGILARSLSPFYGFANIGTSGDSLNALLVSNGKRIALALAGGSHVVVGYGSNDLAAGRTAAQLLADYAALAGFLIGKTLLSRTILPRTSSTDGWATVANQIIPSWEPHRLTFNRAVRGILSGFENYMDTAEVVESGHESGKFDILRGGGAATADGVHLNVGGNVGVRRSSLIKQAIT